MEAHKLDAMSKPASGSAISRMGVWPTGPDLASRRDNNAMDFTPVTTDEFGNPEERHVYHHQANDGPRINAKVERNSKGYNWEATVLGAETPEIAAELLRQIVSTLEQEYGKEKATP